MLRNSARPRFRDRPAPAVAPSVIIAVVIGGIGTLWGPLVGAIVITVVQEVIRRLVGGTGIVGITDVIYGVMLVTIIIFIPDGLVGFFRRWRGRAR